MWIQTKGLGQIASESKRLGHKLKINGGGEWGESEDKIACLPLVWCSYF